MILGLQRVKWSATLLKKKQNNLGSSSRLTLIASPATSGCSIAPTHGIPLLPVILSCASLLNIYSTDAEPHFLASFGVRRNKRDLPLVKTGREVANPHPQVQRMANQRRPNYGGLFVVLGPRSHGLKRAANDYNYRRVKSPDTPRRLRPGGGFRGS